MSGFGQDYRNDIKNMAGLLAEGKKDEVLSGLDNLNWRKIHNISAIVQASELYEACGRAEDAKDLLLMAHDRSPIGRVVLYHLCLLCIRQGEYDEAKGYYEDYVEIAPHDFQKFVLKYNLAKARGADEYTLISILEELRENEFVDEWAYQLAYLYHKTGQVDKCMSVCDEIALYYGDGPYVEKSLELKMLYHPLNGEQEKQYRNLRGISDEDAEATEMEMNYHPMREEIPVPKAAPGKFDTVNLQAEIRKNIDEIMQATQTGEVNETLENIESLVEELPYLKMDESENKTEPADNKDEKESSILEHYKKYLDEEYDGQMSLAIPDGTVQDPQIQGQMTIEDVMANWEKTKRAAEAALQDADKERLEKSKEEALKKANQIMDRLEKAKPLLDAGTDPAELMKEEILSKEPEKETKTEETAKVLATAGAVAGAVVAGAAAAVATGANVAEAAAKTEEKAAEVAATATAGAAAKTAETVAEATVNAAEKTVEAAAETAEKVVEGAANLAGKAVETAASVTENKENPDWKSGITFTIPKVEKDGQDAGVGIEIPVVDGKGNPETEVKVKKTEHETGSWNPPTLDVDESKKAAYEDATKVMEGINDMLQMEIEKLTSIGEEPDVEEEVSSAISDVTSEIRSEEAGAVREEPVRESTVAETTVEKVAVPTDIPVEKITPSAEKPDDKQPAEEHNFTSTIVPGQETADVDIAGDSFEAVYEHETADAEIETPDLKKLHLSDDLSAAEVAAQLAEEAAKQDPAAILAETLVSQELEKRQQREEEKQAEEERNKEKIKGKPDLDKTVVLEQLGEEVRAAREAEEAAVQASKDADSDYEIERLTDEEKELFSYFVPIPNMERTICQVLSGARDHLTNDESATKGNILISGGHGSGKTTLAKAIIMTLQNEVDKPGKNIGRIDADKLNERNIQSIYEKVRGGCLVIEQAGDLRKETAISLSIFMNNDKEGTLFIMEDTKAGINRAIGLDGNFGQKFTERIDIPLFTVDELVNFGIKYATDEGYSVDEMGRLAMYDRITKEQRGDRPMYLRDVIEIMDDAIDKTSSKGFFHRRKVDDEGRPVLLEKDFL